MPPGPQTLRDRGGREGQSPGVARRKRQFRVRARRFRANAIRIPENALAGNAQVGDGGHRGGVQPEVALHREIIRERHLGRVLCGSSRRFVCARVGMNHTRRFRCYFFVRRNEKSAAKSFYFWTPATWKAADDDVSSSPCRPPGREPPRVPRRRRPPRTNPTRRDGRDASRTAPRNPRPRGRGREHPERYFVITTREVLAKFSSRHSRRSVLSSSLLLTPSTSARTRRIPPSTASSRPSNPRR